MVDAPGQKFITDNMVLVGKTQKQAFKFWFKDNNVFLILLLKLF